MKNRKFKYYQDIDSDAKNIVNEFVKNYPITEKILNSIILLYKSAKVEQKFKDDFFETAYHAPITSELEFFISRILYHLSKSYNKQWKILLRRQKSKTAPDIRILKNNRTIAIIEIKAKAGWIQPFLSPERYQNDINKYNIDKSSYDPDKLIEDSKNQLKKYFNTFGITSKDVFLLLPTLALVHRVKYKTELKGYYEYFETTSGLPKENLILLSRNKRLDLSNVKSDLKPTKNFERLLKKLLKY